MSSDRNRVSPVTGGNSRAAAALANGQEYTGTYEPCSGFRTVAVKLSASSTKKIGILQVEFSDNEEDVLVAHRLVVEDHHLGKAIACSAAGGKYFRVRFLAVHIYDSRATPIANDFTNLQIQTSLHNSLDVKDFEIDIANQVVPLQGVESFENGLPGPTSKRLIANNLSDGSIANFPLPTVGCRLRVVTTGADNIVSGTGAQTFCVRGLDNSFQPVFWFGDFAGSGSESTYSPAIFTRVNSIDVLTFGSNGIADVGSTISVHLELQASSWFTVLMLDSTHSFKPDTCIYSVPAGFKGQPLWVNANVSDDALATVSFGILRYGQMSTSNISTFVNGTKGEMTYDFIDPATSIAFAGESFVGEVQNYGDYYMQVFDAALLLKSGVPVDFPTIHTPPSDTTPFTPALVSTALWFDCDDDLTITTDGLTNNVTQMADKSGNGRTATTDVNYAQFLPDRITAGKYALRFNEASMVYDGSFLVDSSYTVFLVAQRNDSRPFQFITGGQMQIGWVFTEFDMNQNGAQDTSAPVDPFDIPRPIIFSGQHIRSTSGSTLINGSPHAYVATNVNVDAGTFYLGYIPGGGYADIDLGEIVMFPFALNATARQIMEGYLAWKWGLQGNLPLDHPYKSAAPTDEVSLDSFIDPATLVWTPTQLDNKTFWFDAENSGSISQPGGYVLEWLDLSANANYLFQTDGGHRPAYEQNAINGLPAIYFDGGSATQFLRLGDHSVFNGANNSFYSLFVLAQSSGYSGPDYYEGNNGCIFGGTGTNKDQNFHSFWKDGLLSYQYNENDFDLPIPPAIGPDTAILNYQQIYDRQLFYNGDNLGFAYDEDNQLSNNSNWAIGRSSEGNFTGYIGEMLMINQIPSAYFRSVIEGYLAWKWGTQGNLTPGHRYVAAPPIITDWTPALIPTLLWFDSSDATTITKVLGNVSVWADKSGNSNDATQGPGGHQPITDFNSFNLTPVITFQGDQYLNVDGSGFINTDYSLFVVLNKYTSDAKYIVGGTGESEGTNFSLQFASSQIVFSQGADILAANASGFTGDITLVEVTKSSSFGTHIYINGQVRGSFPTNTTLLTANDGWAIGKNLTDTFFGDIGEIIALNYVPATPLRQRIEGYLMWKWEINSLLDNFHHHKLIAPLKDPRYVPGNWVPHSSKIVFYADMDSPRMNVFADDQAVCIDAVYGAIGRATTADSITVNSGVFGQSAGFVDGTGAINFGPLEQLQFGRDNFSVSFWTNTMETTNQFLLGARQDTWQNNMWSIGSLDMETNESPAPGGDVIKLDFSNVGDANGGSLADWNSVSSGTTLSTVIRHGDGATSTGISVSFSGFLEGHMNDDTATYGWIGQASDPYYINAVRDIYYHGDPTPLVTTFNGLTPGRYYKVRVYSLLGPSDTTTDMFTIIGNVTQTVSNSRDFRWAQSTLEEGGTVFTIKPSLAGTISIQITSPTVYYPLNAIVLECPAATNYNAVGGDISAISDGNWHHIVGVRVYDTLKLYVNGSLHASNYRTNTVSIDNTSGDFVIGGFSAQPNGQFVGSIEDVCIWRGVALLDEDVAAVYNSNEPIMSLVLPF